MDYRKIKQLINKLEKLQKEEALLESKIKKIKEQINITQTELNKLLSLPNNNIQSHSTTTN
jgi:chaperonin cofactor prefoldin